MKMKQHILIPIIVLFLTPFFSGCTFFYTTEFNLISTHITDNQGFPSLVIKFNNSDRITLTLINPQNNHLFSESYYQGIHETTIPLAPYRWTPTSGAYRIIATDARQHIVFENEMTLTNTSLTLQHITLLRWTHQSTTSIVGINMTITNNGDLPLYPQNVTITNPQISVTGNIFPTSILPHDTISCRGFIYTETTSTALSSIDILLTDYTKQSILNTTITPSIESVDELVFTWTFQGQRQITLPNISLLYQYYHERDRFNLEDYTAYIFDPHDDRYIQFIVDQLLKKSTTSYGANQVNYLASFVQQLPYAEDDPTNTSCEYPRFPIEMITDKQGDCEDKAILTASILDTAGYSVALLRLPNHMAVGVRLLETTSTDTYYIENYYFLETTRVHWKVGEIPAEYEGISIVTVYKITERSLLLHTWRNATRLTGGDTDTDVVRLELRVENIGRAIAKNFQITGAFYTDDGREYNRETITVSWLSNDNELLLNLTLNVPQNVQTKMKTQIRINNTIVHERTSASTFP